MSNQVFVLVKTERLDNGELNVFVDIYEEENAALETLSNEVNKYIEKSGEIHSGSILEKDVTLIDEEENIFTLSVKTKIIK